MDITISPLKRDFRQLASMFNKIRQQFKDDFSDEEIGSVYDEFFTRFNFDSVFPDHELILEARLKDEVIASVGAGISSCKFQGEPLRAAMMGLLALDPQYWDQRNEIYDPLFTELFARARQKGADIIYGAVIKAKNSPEIDFLKNTMGMEALKKNVESKVKILGKEGLKNLRQVRDLNPVAAQAARLVARMKDEELPSGELRPARVKDYPTIVEYLNNYSKRVDLARVWTVEEFHQYLSQMMELKKRNYKSRNEYPDVPFGYHATVWEDGGEIKAYIENEVSEIMMTHGYIPLCFFRNLVFSDEVESDPESAELKKTFMLTLLGSIRSKVAIANAYFPYYDKTFKKAGFIGEQRTTPLLVRSLSVTGNRIIDAGKVKKFYLTFVDFSV